MAYELKTSNNNVKDYVNWHQIYFEIIGNETESYFLHKSTFTAFTTVKSLIVAALLIVAAP